MGATKCTQFKVRHVLNAAVLYDNCPLCRVEAVRALKRLQMLEKEDTKEVLITALSIERCASIVAEIERILIEAGILHNTQDKETKRIPYPHILMNGQDQSLITRDFLVGEQQIAAVEEKLHSLGEKDRVVFDIRQILESSNDL